MIGHTNISITQTYAKVIDDKISEELILCMNYKDGIFVKFEMYSDGEKKGFVNWIYSAKTEPTILPKQS